MLFNKKSFLVFIKKCAKNHNYFIHQSNNSQQNDKNQSSMKRTREIHQNYRSGTSPGSIL